MIEYCNHLREFRKSQVHYLQNELNFNRWKLFREEGKDLGKTASEENYLLNYGSSWFKGFGDTYCSLFCSEENCVPRDNKLNDLEEEIENYRIELGKESHKDISFEEAQEEYLFKLGPSFWKGVTDLVFTCLLNKKNFIKSTPK